MAKEKAMVSLPGQTEKNLKVSGKKVRKMVMGFGNRQKETSTREIGKITSKMGKGCSHM
jgi:hypothetical protein